jgi:MipA family protein
MNKAFFLSRVVTVATMLCPTFLFAQESKRPAGPPPEDRNQITIGFGGGIAPRFNGDDDYGFQPGGIARGKVEGFDFAMRGLNLYVDLAREKYGDRVNIMAGPVVQFRTDRSGDVRDVRVSALGDKKAAIELGGYVGIGKRGVLIPPDNLAFDVSIVKDVTGAHGSFIVKPGITYSSPLSQRTFASLGFSAEYVGAGYGRYYFDSAAPVTPLAAPIVPITAYATNGGGFKSAGVSLLVSHDLGGNNRKGLSVFALTGYSKLLGQYANSALVREAGRPGQFLGVVGVAYSF